MTESSTLGGMDVATKIVLAGGALTVVAAFLPWVNVDAGFVQGSVDGLDGDGVITLVLGAVAMGLVFLRDWDRYTVIGTVVVGALIALIGFMYIADPLAGADVSGPQEELASEMVSPTIGLYLTAIGGLLVAGGGLKGRQVDAKRESADGVAG